MINGKTSSQGAFVVFSSAVEVHMACCFPKIGTRLATVIYTSLFVIVIFISLFVYSLCLHQCHQVVRFVVFSFLSVCFTSSYLSYLCSVHGVRVTNVEGRPRDTLTRSVAVCLRIG